MKTFLKALLMWMAFTMEIHVQASVLQEPFACLKKGASPCTILNQNELEVLDTGVFYIRMNEKAVVRKEAQQRVTIVTGQVLIETKGSGTVQTLYGYLKLNNARALVRVDAHRVSFTSLKGEVEFKPRGGKSIGRLPAGYSNFMSRVSTDGVAPSGYPDPAIIEPLIQSWSGLFRRSERKEFDAQLSEFKKNWQVAIATAGPWYVETIDRQMASLEAERERVRQAEEARRKEREYFRDMFRRRNYLDE